MSEWTWLRGIFFFLFYFFVVEEGNQELAFRAVAKITAGIESSLLGPHIVLELALWVCQLCVGSFYRFRFLFRIIIVAVLFAITTSLTAEV